MSKKQNEPKESSDFYGPPPLLRGEDEALIGHGSVFC